MHAKELGSTFLTGEALLNVVSSHKLAKLQTDPNNDRCFQFLKATVCNITS